MGLILHQYPESSFAEKIRLALGLKGLAWHAVEIPAFEPKPDYTPLTAGYRRTPALQIGADVYCDTRLIAEVLEALAPAPSLFPAEPRLRALGETLITWGESQLMWPIARYITAVHAADFSTEFHLDRARLHGKAPPSVAQVVASAGRFLPQVAPQLAWLEDLLPVGQAFLLGAAPTLADFAVYAAPWFLETIGGADLRAQRAPRTDAWMQRVAAVGHGHVHAMPAADALAVARTATPSPVAQDPRYVAPEGVRPGDRVVVAPFDQHTRAVGRLAAINAERVTLVTESDELGAIAVHFPRLGYRIGQARG